MKGSTAGRQTRRDRWTMPKWMQEYREYIERGAGGHKAEDLMNGHTAIQINAPLAHRRSPRGAADDALRQREIGMKPALTVAGLIVASVLAAWLRYWRRKP